MTGQALDWLPDDALVAPQVLAAIDGRIAEWSGKWFGNRVVSRQDDASARISPTPEPRDGWRALGGGLWIDWNEAIGQSLSLHALDCSNPRPRLSTDDEQLLVRLARRIIDDLADGLGGQGMAGTNSPERGFNFKLSPLGHTFAVPLLVDSRLLVALRKRQCPPWQPPPAARLPLSEIVAAVPVAFDVALGSVSMPLAEFEGLESGDTIVLPQLTGEPLPLVGSDTGTAIGQAKLVHENGRLMLIAS